jgi:5-methyltetrahydropteroyltriglutamate--homocysteine methyltransferase
MQRYRADQVDSLLRPPVLLQVRADHATGKLSADELRQQEDEATLTVSYLFNHRLRIREVYR